MTTYFEDEIKVHNTCRHSDRHNFACGDCIEAQIRVVREEETKKFFKMLFELFSKNSDYVDKSISSRSKE